MIFCGRLFELLAGGKQRKDVGNLAGNQRLGFGGKVYSSVDDIEDAITAGSKRAELVRRQIQLGMESINALASKVGEIWH